MGKIFVFCRIKLNIFSRLYKTRWHTSWTFQLEIAINQKVTAKMPLTNLYEMNSRAKDHCLFVQPSFVWFKRIFIVGGKEGWAFLRTKPHLQKKIKKNAGVCKKFKIKRLKCKLKHFPPSKVCLVFENIKWKCSWNWNKVSTHSKIRYSFTFMKICMFSFRAFADAWI